MEQLQVFEITAEIDEQNSSIDESDEVNENEKTKNNKQEKNRTTSGKDQHHPIFYSRREASSINVVYETKSIRFI